MVGHLAHHQVILIVFLKGLGLLSMVQLTTFVFLGCWALIALAPIIHF
jgi:hypothetical protein